MLGKIIGKACWTISIYMLLALCTFVGVRLLIMPVRVDGASMLPAYHDGEIVLVERLSRLFLAPRVGDVIVFGVVDDAGRTRLMIKRVAAVTDTGVTVRGDNAAVSFDSREFGELPHKLIVGRVAVKVWSPLWWARIKRVARRGKISLRWAFWKEM